MAFEATVKGFLMIFGGKLFIMRLFSQPLNPEVTTTILLIWAEWGCLDIALGLMLYFAFRDPVRNVAILDAIIVGLCLGALVPLLALYVLNATHLYPIYMTWGHSLLRLAVAALLYYLKPREVINKERQREEFSSFKA